MAQMPSMDEALRVEVPEGRLDGMKIERFTISDHDLHNAIAASNGRGTRPGTYTGLWEKRPGRGPEGIPGWCIWMSDTDAERRAHYEALVQAHLLVARRALVNGLGLGMIVKGLLALPDIEHVDVVEIDERVIALTGPTYAADPRVTIHHADALAQARRWPPGTRWDVAWHDIWPEASDRYKSQVTRLMRSYGHRVTWQGTWEHDQMMGRR